MITITDDGARTLVKIAGTADYLAALASDMEDRASDEHVYGVPAPWIGDVAAGLRDAVERGP